MKPSNSAFENRFKDRFANFEANVAGNFANDIKPRIAKPQSARIGLMTVAISLLIGLVAYYFLNETDQALLNAPNQPEFAASDAIIERNDESEKGMEVEDSEGNEINAGINKAVKQLENSQEIKSTKAISKNGDPVEIESNNQIELLDTTTSTEEVSGYSKTSNLNSDYPEDKINTGFHANSFSVKVAELNIHKREFRLSGNLVSWGYIDDFELIENYEVIPERQKTFELYFKINPLLSYQRVDPLLNDDVVITAITSNSLNTKKLGLGVAMGTEFQISSRMNLFGGISFYRTKTFIEYTYHDYIPNDIEIIRNVDGEPISTFVYDLFDATISNKNYSLGLEGGLKYILPYPKIIHRVMLGLDWQNLIESTGSTQFQNSGGLYLILGTETVLNAKGKTEVFIGPQINYGLNANQKSESFGLRAYHVGIVVGLRK